MKELQLDTEFELSTTELKYLEEKILSIIPDKNKILKENLKIIIKYNKTKDEKLINNISAENKKQINKLLINFKHNNILNLHINSKFKFIKEIKLSLISIYHKFSEEYLHNIVQEMEKISHIKIYDFYKETKDQKEIIDKLENSLTIKRFIKKIFPKKGNCNIKILTHLNSELSFDFYSKISNYNDSIQIKYIPESASKNIYISSLFFMLIKYRIKDSNNYKEIVLYLEPSTNWGVVSKSHSIGFASQFLKLLNNRFNEQFKNKSKLDFKPKVFPTNVDYENDIDNILQDISKELKDNKTELDNEILLKIHKLKTKYVKINNAYKLLKSFYYFLLYIHTIKNKMKHEELKNTQYIVNSILNKNYIDIIKRNLIKMNQNNLQNKYKNISIKKLRLGLIEEINNQIAIVDIFPNMNWIKKEKIFQNFDYIINDKEKLNYFYETIKSENIIDKDYFFKEKIIPKIINGKKIIINNLN